MKTNRMLGMLLVLSILTIAGVSATLMTLNPESTNMPTTGAKDVMVCINTTYRTGPGPVVGMPLVITRTCVDTNHNTFCDNSDTDVVNNEFYVTVKQSPTDNKGCGVITLHTNDAGDADYSYQVSGMNAGQVAIVENGSVYVPEMGIVGAGAVLAVVGLFVARKRKD